jgi:hypothetical protein
MPDENLTTKTRKAPGKAMQLGKPKNKMSL